MSCMPPSALNCLHRARDAVSVAKRACRSDRSARKMLRFFAVLSVVLMMLSTSEMMSLLFAMLFWIDVVGDVAMRSRHSMQRSENASKCEFV